MAAGAAAAAAGAAAAAAGFAPPDEMAASTSRLTTRPCGPEPEMAAMSSPASLAMRRASGEEKVRPTDDGLISPPVGEMAGRPEGGVCEEGGVPPSVGFADISPTGGEIGASAAGAATGAASPPPLAASAASSPSAARMAISALTFTPSVPAGTTILATVPSSTASTSMVALSVSISAMTSPGEIASPSLTSHLARLPSSMVGDRAGIVMLMGISSSPYAV